MSCRLLPVFCDDLLPTYFHKSDNVPPRKSQYQDLRIDYREKTSTSDGHHKSTCFTRMYTPETRFCYVMKGDGIKSYEVKLGQHFVFFSHFLMKKVFVDPIKCFIVKLQPSRGLQISLSHPWTKSLALTD